MKNTKNLHLLFSNSKTQNMIIFKKGEIPDFPFRQAVKKPIPVRCMQMQEAFQVETMEGVLEGKPGDYLMIGVRGEMYPCAKDIFNETYEFIKPE
jgi:hypothetical protein